MLHENNKFYLEASDLSALSFRVCSFSLDRFVNQSQESKVWTKLIAFLNLRRITEE